MLMALVVEQCSDFVMIIVDLKVGILSIMKVLDRSSFNRQKSYANQWHRPIEFHIRDKVFFRVSLTRGVMRLGK